jgi:hypothetical protein
VRPKATQGTDAFAGVTADQFAAQQIGQDTLLPSLELGTEDHSGLIGSCDRDYGCIYMNTLSWTTATTPLPMEINPRKVFERMFGRGGSTAERIAQSKEDRSILDLFMKQAADLEKKLGPQDRTAMNDYLESVREIERRVQRMSVEGAVTDVPIPSAPAGIPYSYEDHVKLMYDLMLLSYQANITKVVTYMLAREISNRTYPQVGVSDGHHAISHHSNQAAKMDKNVKIQTYHMGLFAGFLDKMAATPDGDGSLLDHTILIFGSNMSNSNAHNHFPLPNLVIGGGAGHAQRRTAHQVRGPHASDKPSLDGSGQSRRQVGQTRRQHRIDGGPVRHTANKLPFLSRGGVAEGRGGVGQRLCLSPESLLAAISLKCPRRRRPPRQRRQESGPCRSFLPSPAKSRREFP